MTRGLWLCYYLILGLSLVAMVYGLHMFAVSVDCDGLVYFDPFAYCVEGTP